MQCYVFRASGDLASVISDTGDPAVRLPDDPIRRSLLSAQQKVFYHALSPNESEKFESFCRGKYRTSAADYVPLPSLLLFPTRTFAAVFAERYTSHLLSHCDPLPGVVSCVLNPSHLHRLTSDLPGHHRILSLLYQSLSDLYSTASPVLATVPALARNILSELEKLHSTNTLISDTLPCLKAYRTELYASDTPVFLDLAQILPRLAAWLPASPVFSSLDLDFLPPDTAVSPETYQVRFSASAFTSIFVLLSYVCAVLSGDGIVTLSLYRRGTDACLSFQIETDQVPVGFASRSEFHSLSGILPRYTGFLTLAQYLLHRSGIPFFCSVTAPEIWPVLEITLEMDTRFREEIEFRCGDPDTLLAQALPDALSLLCMLTE